MAVDGLLSLRWNNHSSSFLKQLSFLRDKEIYSDLTLVCGGQFYQVHRLVVSGCSEYFRAILEHTPCRHPAVVLQDVPPRHLEALLSYMYLGQVSVPQEELGGLIKAAECLAIKGLAVPDEATPPPQQESQGRPTPNQEEGPPHPKRRRQDREASTPAPPAQGDDSSPEDYKEARWRGSRGSSPQPPPITTPSQQQQHTLMEEMTVIRVKEEEEEVKCEEDNHLVLSDPCEGLAGQQDSSQGKESQATYSPALPGTGGGGNSVLPQYPSQPQSFEEVVSQALPGDSGMHEDTGQGWEGSRNKGDMTTAFPLDTFAPQQESLPPIHHTPLHQRGPGRSGWSRQGPRQQPHYSTLQGDMGTPWPAIIRTTIPQASGEGASLLDHRICQICGYKGQDVSQLRKHLRIHTGEKPFQCPGCSYSSAQSSNLKVHIKRYHPTLCQMDASPKESQQTPFLIQ